MQTIETFSSWSLVFTGVLRFTGVFWVATDGEVARCETEGTSVSFSFLIDDLTFFDSFPAIPEENVEVPKLNYKDQVTEYKKISIAEQFGQK